jgi:proline dehydrogenase
LKQTPDFIALDLERSRREGWFFAAKLVRGAYMVAERARAHELGIESPIHETLEETHKCYNDMIKVR